MSATVFFSWQSDRPKNEGRNLIERALEKAVKNLARDVEIREAVRDDIEVDSDTRKVPGSPKIFETILEKIEKAAVVIADMTYVGFRPNGHPTPNPNVLIEYGYALKCIGERRIILVMNTAYGEPKREDMPFDLLAHRFPITYRVDQWADESVRKAQADGLAKVLESAIRTFFESDEHKNSLPKPAPVSYRAAQDGKARFRPKGEAIGIRSSALTRVFGSTQKKLFLSDGPSVWLRVGPTPPVSKPWKVVDLEQVARKLILLPFCDPGQSISGVRGPDGYGFYNTCLEDELAPSLVYVFTDAEIWSINSISLS